MKVVSTFLKARCVNALFFSSGLQRELLQKEEELKAKTADIERLIPNSQISESTVTCPDHMENVSAYFFSLQVVYRQAALLTPKLSLCNIS